MPTVVSTNAALPLIIFSPSLHPDFHHYTALRSPDAEIATGYPPIAPAVDWGDTYATDRFVTSGADASIIPSDTTWFYRLMAYDADGAVIGTSPVRSGQLRPVDELGPVEVEVDAGGRTRLRWDAYDGPADCFSHYRVQYGTSGSPNTVLAIVSGRETAELGQLFDHLHDTFSSANRVANRHFIGSFACARPAYALAVAYAVMFASRRMRIRSVSASCLARS